MSNPVLQDISRQFVIVIILVFFSGHRRFSIGHRRFNGRWCPYLNLGEISISISGSQDPPLLYSLHDEGVQYFVHLVSLWCWSLRICKAKPSQNWLKLALNYFTAKDTHKGNSGALLPNGTLSFISSFFTSHCIYLYASLKINFNHIWTSLKFPIVFVTEKRTKCSQYNINYHCPLLKWPIDISTQFSVVHFLPHRT